MRACVCVCVCARACVLVCQNVQHGKNALVHEIMFLEKKFFIRLCSVPAFTCIS